MNRFVIYLKLEPYLHEWLTNAMGTPVKFPAGTAQNAVIRRFLQKLPAGKNPEMAAENLTPIIIPDSKAKNPAIYNYLGDYAKGAITEMIEDMFRRNLWDELMDLTKSTAGINNLIFAWCEIHGISIDHAEAVRQKFYRMRKSYAKKGIIFNCYAKKNKDIKPFYVQPQTTLHECKKLKP